MANKPHSERLSKGLANINEAMLADASAEIARRLAAGEKVAPDVFLPDTPDPLGINWDGVEQSLTQESKAITIPKVMGHDSLSASISLKKPDTRRIPPVYVAAGAFLAAALLITLGIILSRNNGSQTEMAFQVTSAPDVVRGPNAPVILTVDNQSTRVGFITIVGLNGRRSPIHYQQSDTFLEISPGQSRTIELPDSFAALTDAIVILTATPAGDAVTKTLDAEAIPADLASAQNRLLESLRKFGYQGSTLKSVQLSSKGN